MNCESGMRLKSRTIARRLLRPFRGPVSWASQRGFVIPQVRKIAPKSWTFEPFTIYGPGWKCRWFPAKFDRMGRELFWTGLRNWEEKETVPVMLENMKRSRCFVDVGANCGVYTILGCASNPSLRVVAVEPVPKVFAALVNNVRQNGVDPRVVLLNVAVGDSNGTVPFHEAEAPAMGSLSVSGYHGQRGRLIRVECRTLDSIVEELNVAPDFLKIDVEGFAHAVLAGASRTLSKFRPRIIIEANPGDPCEQVTDILVSHQYTLHHITPAGLRRMDKIIPAEGEGYRNWLCLPDDRPADDSR
jgi:FkbM family methyltransferase